MAVVQYTYTHKEYTEDTKQTIHRTTQKLGRMRAVPRLCRFYPGICLTTEEKARKTLSQGSSQISRGSVHEDGKDVSPTHRPPLLPRKYSWFLFLLEALPYIRSLIYGLQVAAHCTHLGYGYSAYQFYNK